MATRTDHKTSPCGGGSGRGCGRPMVWAEVREVDKQTGKDVVKRIPLDPSAPVYRITRHDASGTAVAVRDRDAMVSHFKTCPKAGEFSAKPGERGEAILWFALGMVLLFILTLFLLNATLGRRLDEAAARAAVCHDVSWNDDEHQQTCRQQRKGLLDREPCGPATCSPWTVGAKP